MEKNCDKYPFDYNKHIVIKTIMTPRYRKYTEFEQMFQGVSTYTCDNCMVGGFDSVSMPFKFEDLKLEEIRCTLMRMGIKRLDIKDVDIMHYIQEHSGQMLCGECHKEKEDKELADSYAELEVIQLDENLEEIDIDEDVKEDK